MASSIPIPADVEVSRSDGDCPPNERGDVVLLRHLDDHVNRCFLDLMSIEWRTAQELTEICDTPLSTTYRKVNALEEMGLIEQRIRINGNGKHPGEYRSKPMEVTFRLGQSTGLEISVNIVSDRTP